MSRTKPRTQVPEGRPFGQPYQSKQDYESEIASLKQLIQEKDEELKQ